MKVQIHDNTYKNIDSTFQSTKMTIGAENESLKYQMAIVNVGKKYLNNKLENSKTSSEYLKIRSKIILLNKMYWQLSKAWVNLDEDLKVDNYLTEYDRYLQTL